MLFADEQVVLQVPRTILESSIATPIAALAVILNAVALIVLVIADMAALKTSGTIFINNWRHIFGESDPSVIKKNNKRHKMRNRRISRKSS